MIAILDYEMGNLSSIYNAVSYLGFQAVITRDPSVIEKADGIILPGVGAFKVGMAHLHEFGLIEPIRRHVVEEEKPLFGICLGMQLLVEVGYEHGETKGLGIVKGEAVPFKDVIDPKLRIPHVGWNSVKQTGNSQLFGDIKADSDFYFVHSYIVRPRDPDVVCSVTDYGVDFCSSLSFGSAFATQFHPEKSHTQGLQLLKNWLEGIEHA